jgi:hypothetical protein
MNEYIDLAQGYASQYLGPVWGPTAFTVGKSLVMIALVLAPLLLVIFVGLVVLLPGLVILAAAASPPSPTWSVTTR